MSCCSRCLYFKACQRIKLEVLPEIDFSEPCELFYDEAEYINSKVKEVGNTILNNISEDKYYSGHDMSRYIVALLEGQNSLCELQPVDDADVAILPDCLKCKYDDCMEFQEPCASCVCAATNNFEPQEGETYDI